VSADERRSEVILLVPSPEIRNHVRALLEMDGYETTDAKDADHAQELARAASAFAVLVQPESKRPLERLEALLEKQSPNVDVLKPAGFGHALIEGTLDRRRTLFGLDALALLAGSSSARPAAPRPRSGSPSGPSSRRSASGSRRSRSSRSP